MKIIGTTKDGYICEASRDEMRALTGVDEPWGGHTHNVGTDVKVIPLKRHIDNMKYTVTQRKSAAELLRAAATVIEQVPDAFTYSEEPQSNPAP